MIEIVYQTFIIAGLVIFLVLFYLKRLARNFLVVLTEIIKMNELNEYDPVKFVEILPPMMKRLGIKDYSYYFYFMDTEYQKIGASDKNSIKKFVSTTDFTVYVEIMPGRLRWERSYLAVLLTETIFLLLKIDVALFLKANTKAFSEFSKINTFVTHDIKNLAQFISIMEHNLSKPISESQKDKLFEYLKSTAPSLKKRADKVLGTLSTAADERRKLYEDIDIFDEIEKLASMFNIMVYTGKNRTLYKLEKKGLLVILENIIKNFYDKSISEEGIELFAEISETDSHITLTLTDTGSLIPNPEKIFEPFYSEKSGGLGIGLYHCRNMALNMQGKIWAENTEKGPCFFIRFKKEV